MNNTIRKRLRSDSEEDESNQGPIYASDLKQEIVLQGLYRLWNLNSPKAYQLLYDELQRLYIIAKEPNLKIKRIKHRHPTIPKPVKSLIDPLLRAVQMEEFKDQLHDDNGVPNFAHLQHHLQPNSKKRDDSMVSCDNQKYLSQLQDRYKKFIVNDKRTGLGALDKNIRNYYMYLALEEHEMKNGPLDDEEYELSIVDGSCWTPAEKKRFFLAVERCTRGDVVEIARRVGPTKTVNEVAAYLNLLDAASNCIGNDPDESYKIQYSAKEMSPLFMMQETRMATLLEEKIEIENYDRHQRLIQDNNPTLEKAMELFEVWNMSSLTHFFSDFKDMTLLSSTIVHFYELLKTFIIDILAHVHTELLDKKDKTISRALMNFVIAKRQRIWTDINEESDRRLKDLDIMSILDKRKDLHEQYAQNKTASYLAKRRRKGWMNKDNDTGDDMLQPFDVQDKLPPSYHMVYEHENFRFIQSKLNSTRLFENEIGINQKNKDLVNIREKRMQIDESEDSAHEENNSSNDESNVSYNDDDESDSSVNEENFIIEKDLEIEAEKELEEDKLLEMKMKESDKSYEAKLIQQLGFYDAEQVMNEANKEPVSIPR
ncbi:uncharacterized protein BX663DRAFT_554450 [Cokeromyces recurvatus]|uniref:uncharacterized protein n=1 Tax=Cokeromyces recurvatus TaxID=90255 RepID=UPI002220C641|nr:uncharacterized protein BX663DRAFT_554450 [Cokeromyces recurvatus]KAI7900001.1 hypothetical protein BX663DRAFT_554450 [Cokeromyces recurvatus]